MRSLLVLVLLAGSAAADPLVDQLVGKTYEVTTTYTQGPPPDCGQTPRGFRPCPPPKTKTVTRVVTVRAQDVVITAKLVGAREVHCATLATPPSPDPNYPHALGDPKVTPRGKAPKLPLCGG